MNKAHAERIIDYVVTKTKQRWTGWIYESYSNLDDIFIVRGYEQGGFAASIFFDLLRTEEIGTIQKIGSILESYKGENKYSRPEKGSLESPFYRKLKEGFYNINGRKFYKCVNVFLKKSLGNPGAWFWVKLWQMLICCRDLKQNYQSSFKYHLKKKYSDFIKRDIISDEELFDIDVVDWERFKKEAEPWNELYGIGENVFDFLIGDIKEFKFNKNSFKLDAANIHFFNVTGISKLVNINNRDLLIEFLKGLKLRGKYALREINTGIYTYCSDTERKKFGFCRDRDKCDECGINLVCEKNF